MSFHQSHSCTHIIQPDKNSGILLPSSNEPTDDGYDLSFGTNVLGKFANISLISIIGTLPGHFYLTKLLLLALSNAQEGRKARVIDTASFMHLLGSSAIGSGLEFDTFKDGPKRRGKGKIWLYGQSKFVRYPVCEPRLDPQRRYDDRSASSPLNRQISSSLKSWPEDTEIRSFRLQPTQVRGISSLIPAILVTISVRQC